MPVAHSYSAIAQPLYKDMIIKLTYTLREEAPDGIGLKNNGEEEENKINREIVGTLSAVPIDRNRMIQRNQHNYICVSFEELKHEDEDDRKRYVNHIKYILTNGIKVGDQTFLFCGHSNSQLKSRMCFMYAASNHTSISRMINSYGDFEKIQDVAKRSKRIGLLFSSSNLCVNLDEHQFMEMDDIAINGRVYTDGCGFISQQFANEIALKYYSKNICKGVNTLHVPQVLQIRYKGYKGTLVVQKDEVMKKIAAELAARRSIFMRIYIWILTYFYCLKGETKVIFRKSMKKFSKCEFNELFVLERSKPTVSAKLNGEFVSILSALGIPDEIFIQKLRKYFEYIQNASKSREAAIEFMEYKGHYKVLRKLRQENPHLEKVTRWINEMLYSAQKDEFKLCYDKKEIERVHIMIPKSRLLIGVCDISGILKEGECYVRYTTDKKSLASAALKGPIIVGRNPCLHPGDIQIFTALNEIEELEHLVDCIVFSTAGKLPPASQLSGGDLDGDKFFVCWDSDLIPVQCADPLDYSAIQPKPTIPFTHKNNQIDLINYFANFNTTSLGKVTSLYKEWIRVKLPIGANSPECLMLNELYCKCVDGEDIDIPPELYKPPELPPTARKSFILDVITKEIHALLGDRYHRILERNNNPSMQQDKEKTPPPPRKPRKQQRRQPMKSPRIMNKHNNSLPATPGQTEPDPNYDRGQRYSNSKAPEVPVNGCGYGVGQDFYYGVSNYYNNHF